MLTHVQKIQLGLLVSTLFRATLYPSFTFFNVFSLQLVIIEVAKLLYHCTYLHLGLCLCFYYYARSPFCAT